MAPRSLFDLPPDWKFDPRAALPFMGGWGHGGHLKLDYVDHGEDWAELSLDWREELVGEPDTGVLASAVIISLMDIATSLSVWTKFGKFRPQATMDLRVDYLRPSPKGAKVYGRGTCYHLSHSVAFVRGFAHNGNADEPLAYVTGRVGDRIA
jgi:uncharacterized protein (TIGR00369 family)